MIKAMRPIDIRPGDLVYCGVGRGRAWRKVLRVEPRSVYRYAISLDGSHFLEVGSACKKLVNSAGKPHGF